MAQIKKDTNLRKAILQAAVTGKLISSVCHPDHDGHSELVSESSELNAKALLKKIIAERNKKLLLDWQEALKTNPNAKKPAAVAASKIDENEIPFEIPENWCWCRLGDVVTILGDGLHGTPKYDISGEYYFVNGNNLNNGLIEIKPDTKKINKKEFEKYKKDLNDLTIFISINGTIGNIAFYNNEKIILGKSACYFNVAIKELKKYFFYLFQTDFFFTYALDNATGTTIKNVSLGTMRNFLIPLPPLAVQDAIVEKLEQVLPLVDAYEDALLQKEELKGALKDKLKKSILQEAVQGKLISTVVEPVETTAETGRQLLDRIIAERNAKLLAEWKEALKTNPKARNPAPVAAGKIDEDEIPFEIPKNWCWCRLGDICNLYTGNSINETEKKTKYTNLKEGRFYIGTKDVGFDNVINYDNGIKIPFDNDKFRIANANTILMCIEGGSAGRKIAFTDKAVCFGNKLCCFDAYVKESIHFLYYFMQSALFTDLFKDNMNGIIGGVSVNTLKTMLIPLPPLAVQNAIVAKLEQVLLLVDALD